MNYTKALGTNVKNKLNSFVTTLLVLACSLLASLPARATPTLNAGDVVVIGWSAISNTVRILPLVTIPSGTVLNFTDQGWNQATNAFSTTVTTDGTISWTTTATINAGTILSLQIGQSSPSAASTPVIMTDVTNNVVLWTSAALPASVTITGFTLTTGDPMSIAGDQILIYQDTAANPFFIFGFNNSGGTVDATNWNTSLAPTLTASMIPNGTGSQNALTNGVDAIGMVGGASQQDNVQYTGPTTGTNRAGWLARFTTLSNWSGDNTGTTVVPTISTSSGTSVSVVSPQTITFGAQSAQTFSTGGTFAVNPLATASSGLTVTYSSTTTGVCTVSGSTVTMVSAGTCTIAADQAGNSSFSAAAQ